MGTRAEDEKRWCLKIREVRGRGTERKQSTVIEERNMALLKGLRKLLDT
jgi:hypothetical protein